MILEIKNKHQYNLSDLTSREVLTMKKKRIIMGVSIAVCLAVAAGAICLTQLNEDDMYYATNISSSDKVHKPVSAKKADTKSIKPGKVFTVNAEEEDLTRHKVGGQYVEENQDITDLLPLHERPVDIKEETENSIDLMDLFGFRLGEVVSKEEKEQSRKELLDSTYGKDLLKFTPEVIQRYANGAFAWDYRNMDNKEDFLAFRTGTYFHKDNFLTADKLYEEIHERIDKHKFIFEYEFGFMENDIYSNPTRGGYTISGTLKFKYTSDKGSVLEGFKPDTWYSLDYETDFNWNTPSDTDNWPMWDDGKTGLSASQSYILQ